jgi:glycosyltransferase involved in cell wall biosynthesis
MALEPEIAAIVPTHNRRERLPELLNAVLAEPFTEVIVVVNGSGDGSLALLERQAEDDPRLRPLAIEVASKPAAVQRGIEEAKSEVALVLDDDVLPRPGLAAGHSRHHAAARGRVIVGYMPVVRRSSRLPGEYATDLYSRAYEHVCDEYEADPSSILEGLWGGNVSLRREDALRMYDRHNCMDPPHSRHEDREFGLRCAALGLEAVFDRDLLAEHRHRISPQGFLATMRNSGRNRWTIHHEHFETLGSLPADFFLRDVHPAGRALVRLSRRERGYRPVRTLLSALTAATGKLQLFRAETHLAWLLGMVEQQRGAREAARDAGSVGP